MPLLDNKRELELLVGVISAVTLASDHIQKNASRYYQSGSDLSNFRGGSHPSARVICALLHHMT